MFCSIDIYSLKERKTGLKNAYIIYLIQSHLHEKKKNKLTPDIITLIFFL